MTPRRIAAALLLLAAGAALLPLLADRAPPADDAPAPAATPALLERGRVLALAGNCAGCHSTRGGAPYAGGRGLATPFGTVYAGNITPDAATGIGAWSAGTFWRALHHGRGADGRRLVPAFPYTETTRVTRADSDALYLWLRTVPAAAQPNRAHELRWPYDTALALAWWRTLFFDAGSWQDDAAQAAAWNRGAYLVNGVGHCVACHGERNAFGATSRSGGFGGGWMPMRSWYAPALDRADQAGVADWPLDQIVMLLRDGASPRGRAVGPMAEVVRQSTQHLPADDLLAMATYLQSLPQRVAPAPARPVQRDAQSVAAGAALYRDHCAACHGDTGDGGVLAGSGRLVVPALAGNRRVTMDPPATLVRVIVQGGFGAATRADPRPFGMPPFAHVLGDEQIALVASHLRANWGANAAPVSTLDVSRWRGGEP